MSHKLNQITAISIDPEKLTADGHQIVGRIEALTRWADKLNEWVGMTDNIVERVTFKTISGALTEDAEASKIALIAEAKKCGAFNENTNAKALSVDVVTGDGLPKH